VVFVYKKQRRKLRHCGEERSDVVHVGLAAETAEAIIDGDLVVDPELVVGVLIHLERAIAAEQPDLDRPAVRDGSGSVERVLADHLGVFLFVLRHEVPADDLADTLDGRTGDLVEESKDGSDSHPDEKAHHDEPHNGHGAENNGEDDGDQPNDDGEERSHD